MLFLVVIRRIRERIEGGRGSANSQRPYAKNRAQSDFLLLGHMQSPNSDDRYNQNHEIAHNINDASADKYGVLIKALLSSCNFVCFTHAFGHNGEN